MSIQQEENDKRHDANKLTKIITFWLIYFVLLLNGQYFFHLIRRFPGGFVGEILHWFMLWIFSKAAFEVYIIYNDNQKSWKCKFTFKQRYKTTCINICVVPSLSVSLWYLGCFLYNLWTSMHCWWLELISSVMNYRINAHFAAILVF